MQKNNLKERISLLLLNNNSSITFNWSKCVLDKDSKYLLKSDNSNWDFNFVFSLFKI